MIPLAGHFTKSKQMRRVNVCVSNTGLAPNGEQVPHASREAEGLLVLPLTPLDRGIVKNLNANALPALKET